MNQEIEWIEWQGKENVYTCFGKKNNKDYYIRHKKTGEIKHINKASSIISTNIKNIKKSKLKYKEYSGGEILKRNAELV